MIKAGAVAIRLGSSQKNKKLMISQKHNVYSLRRPKTENRCLADAMAETTQEASNAAECFIYPPQLDLLFSLWQSV